MTVATKTVEKPAISHKSSEKRRRILAAAANEINAKGVGGVSFDEVANAAGLSRNALYHYVSDRGELAYLCFARSCEALMADIELAIAQSSDPSTQLEALVSINLTSHSCNLAAFGDYEVLSEDQRAQILNMEAEIRSGIAAIVSQGITTGQFRMVDPLLVTDCLLGMINWVRLSERWLEHDITRERLANAITDLLLRGFANGPQISLERWPTFEQLTVRNSNPFDRKEMKEQKRQQILGVASQLFNRRGIEGTSLSDIVSAIGATKGVFYHYFEDKNELVIECYRRAFDLYGSFAETASAVGANGVEKAMITNHLNCQAQFSSIPPLTLQRGLDTLSEPVRSQLAISSRKVWEKVQILVSEGVSDGSCRQIDVRAATEVAAGPFFWLVRNREPRDPQEAWATADAICDVIGHGVFARKGS